MTSYNWQHFFSCCDIKSWYILKSMMSCFDELHVLTVTVMSDIHRLFTIFKVFRKNGNPTIMGMIVVFQLVVF